MTDLFAAATTTSVPEYGSLTPSQELTLFNTDRPTWVLYVAPNAAMRLVRGGEDSIRLAWPFMGADYKKAVWHALDLAGRRVIRAALDGAAVIHELDKVPA